MDEMSEVFESVARYFALLSEPTRLRIMHCVCQHEKSVGQIVEEAGVTQTNASRHLAMMYQGGMVTRRREGNQVFYRVSDHSFTEICRAVCVRVAAEAEGDRTLKRTVKTFIDELG
jgi:DNA-binding transcriptional ArsR family regulator